MLSTEQNERGRWGQLTYTVCEGVGKDRATGWQVKQVSAGTREEETASILRSIREFSLATRPSPFAPPEEIAQLPRRLAFVPLPDGSALLVHTVHAGPDASRRPDNTFTHVLLDRDFSAEAGRGQGPRPIEYWDSDRWLQPFGALAVEAAVFEDDLPPVPAATVGRRASVTMVQELGHEHTFGLLLDATALAVRSGRRLVLLSGSATEGAAWLGAVSAFAPVPFLARVSFSTFERPADALRPDGPLICVVLREEAGQLPPRHFLDVGALLVDLNVESDSQVGVDADGSPAWEDALGQLVPETPWSQMALGLCNLDEDSVVDGLARMDALAQSRPAVAAQLPFLPLAQVVQDTERLVIYDDLMQRARSLTAPPAPATATATTAPAVRAQRPAAPSQTLEDADSGPSSGHVSLVPRRPKAAMSPQAEGGAAAAWERLTQAIGDSSMHPGTIAAAYRAYVERAMNDRGWLTAREPAPCPDGDEPWTHPTDPLEGEAVRALWECHATARTGSLVQQERTDALVWRLRLLDFLVRCRLLSERKPGPMSVALGLAATAVLELYIDPEVAQDSVGDLSAQTVNLLLRPALSPFLETFARTQPVGKRLPPPPVGQWLARCLGSLPARTVDRLDEELSFLGRPPSTMAAARAVTALTTLLADPAWALNTNSTDRANEALQRIAPADDWPSAALAELVEHFAHRADLDFWAAGMAALRAAPANPAARDLAHALLAVEAARPPADGDRAAAELALVRLHDAEPEQLLDPTEPMIVGLPAAALAWWDARDESQKVWVAERVGLLCLGHAIGAGARLREGAAHMSPPDPNQQELRMTELLIEGARHLDACVSNWRAHFRSRPDDAADLVRSCGSALSATVPAPDDPIAALVRPFPPELAASLHAPDGATYVLRQVLADAPQTRQALRAAAGTAAPSWPETAARKWWAVVESTGPAPMTGADQPSRDEGGTGPTWS